MLPPLLSDPAKYRVIGLRTPKVAHDHTLGYGSVREDLSWESALVFVMRAVKTQGEITNMLIQYLLWC